MPGSKPRDAVVWSLQPFELNRLSVPGFPDEYPITWSNLPDPDSPDPKQLARSNIRGAWERDGKGQPVPVGHELPAAVLGTGKHERIHAQRGCFTVHGLKKGSLGSLVGKK